MTLLQTGFLLLTSSASQYIVDSKAKNTSQFLLLTMF